MVPKSGENRRGQDEKLNAYPDDMSLVDYSLSHLFYANLQPRDDHGEKISHILVFSQDTRIFQLVPRERMK